MRLFVACTSLMLATATLHAQDATEAPAAPAKHFEGSELMLGHGFFPADQMFANAGRSYDNGYSHNIKNSSTGAISLTYRYRVSKVLSVGLSAAFEHGRVEYDQPPIYLQLESFASMPDKTSYVRSTISIAPEFVFTYFDAPNDLIQLYSTIGAGYTFRHQVREEDYNSYHTQYEDINARQVHFNGYISPIGLRFGHTLSGFIELGIGYKGVLNYGLSYRF